MSKSLESAMAEEAAEVMALIEGRQRRQSEAPKPMRAQSPMGATKSPMRSMLDVAGPPAGRHNSIAAATTGITRLGLLDASAPPTTRSSMLDPMAPPASSLARNTALNARPASRSPAPPIRVSAHQNAGVEDLYKFDAQPSNDANALPKRVSMGKGLGAGLFGNRDQSSGGKREHRGSFLSGKGKSMSPGPGRSRSPGGALLNNNGMNLLPTPGKYVSDTGQVIDMNTAYRRLSDAALLKSGSTLANLPFRREMNIKTGEEQAPDGGVRLTKDFHADEDIVDSSDEEAVSTDEEDTYVSNERRGRVRARKGSNEPAELMPMGSSQSSRQPKSLLWAVEEERKDVSTRTPYRSLLEPEVKVTGPDGEKADKSGKRGIHPSTSFDNQSDISTPYDTDREEVLTDVRQAQKMQVTISPTHNTPSAQRSIRQIIRGDFESFQKEAELGLRRQRMYLVATDLSDEAAYALEWTIGTVLRDGDTLLAVYVIDEELGTGVDHPNPSSTTHTNPTTAHHSHTSSVDKSASEVVGDLSSLSRTLSHEAAFNNTLTIPGNASSVDGASPTSANFPLGGRPTQQELDKMDKNERERFHCVQEVTDRCVRLLRKTKLQVRVVVEVLHAKSPKHMLTEVIDYLVPTLVILGSRGRSALKGVLLGSFSNYLVTKSSVPVMVARKKLRKHSKSAGLRTSMRLSNMLAGGGEGKFSRLETAKIDRPMATRSSSIGTGGTGKSMLGSG